MHVTDFTPRPLLLFLLALSLTLLALAAMAPEVGTLDVSIGGDGAAAPADAATPADAAPAGEPSAGEPAWRTDPLAPPLGR